MQPHQIMKKKKKKKKNKLEASIEGFKKDQSYPYAEIEGYYGL